jgi:clan AA aspartic protease (TIGR02281 family)
MRKKIALSVLWLVFSLLMIFKVNADTVYLKNGRQIEGIIKEENNSEVILEIPLGTLKFRKSEIKSLEKKTDGAAANRTRQIWEEDKKAKIEAEKMKREYAPKEIGLAKQPSGHVVVKAVLNKKVNANLMVDTGASVLVLSKKIGDALGLTDKKSAPVGNQTIQLTVGDGRKMTAQYALLESVVVEAAEVNNVAAAINPDEKADIGYDGVLGMSFLSKFNFKFDNKENKLILEKLK